MAHRLRARPVAKRAQRWGNGRAICRGGEDPSILFLLPSTSMSNGKKKAETAGTSGVGADELGGTDDGSPVKVIAGSPARALRRGNNKSASGASASSAMPDGRGGAAAMAVAPAALVMAAAVAVGAAEEVAPAMLAARGRGRDGRQKLYHARPPSLPLLPRRRSRLC